MSGLGAFEASALAAFTANAMHSRNAGGEALLECPPLPSLVTPIVDSRATYNVRNTLVAGRYYYISETDGRWIYERSGLSVAEFGGNNVRAERRIVGGLSAADKYVDETVWDGTDGYKFIVVDSGGVTKRFRVPSGFTERNPGACINPLDYSQLQPVYYRQWRPTSAAAGAAQVTLASAINPAINGTYAAGFDVPGAFVDGWRLRFGWLTTAIPTIALPRIYLWINEVYSPAIDGLFNTAFGFLSPKSIVVALAQSTYFARAWVWNPLEQRDYDATGLLPATDPAFDVYTNPGGTAGWPSDVAVTAVTLPA